MPISFPDIAPAIDPPLQAALQRRIDGKTKPLGALGRIEQVAIQLGLIQRTERPVLRDPQLIVFAADHGLAAHGVSAYPSDVTWQMVENFLSGGAAVSVLARQHGIALTVVDAGVRHDFQARPGLVLEHKQAHGTADALRQAAMDPAQCERAVRAGMATVRALPGNAVLLGEMGIGNTSSAALLLSRLAGLDIDACTGRGTGLDDDALARKRGVLREVLARHVHATDPWDVLAAFGGFEIAMLAGAALQAAIERRVVMVDGFIAGAAVLWASRLAPQVLGYCIWAHRSAEAGHRLLVEALGARPLLDLELRLGEGSGAALAWPLVESAARILDEMASFESAGVSGKVET